MNHPLVKFKEEQIESNAGNLSEADRKLYDVGKAVYEQTCFGCHQPNGKGVPKVAPQIAASDWVERDDATLARVMMHGLEGLIHVNGKPQEDIKVVMPAHGTFLNDEQIAGVITYIRNTWGNTGPAIEEKVVRKVREAAAKRLYPWTEAELTAES